MDTTQRNLCDPSKCLAEFQMIIYSFYTFAFIDVFLLILLDMIDNKWQNKVKRYIISKKDVITLGSQPKLKINNTQWFQERLKKYYFVKKKTKQ